LDGFHWEASSPVQQLLLLYHSQESFPCDVDSAWFGHKVAWIKATKADKNRIAKRIKSARNEIKHLTEEEVDLSEIENIATLVFPVLECLDLPYETYGCGDDAGSMSYAMRRELLRCYEYELISEWYQEQIMEEAKIEV